MECTMSRGPLRSPKYFKDKTQQVERAALEELPMSLQLCLIWRKAVQLPGNHTGLFCYLETNKQKRLPVTVETQSRKGCCGFVKDTPNWNSIKCRLSPYCPLSKARWAMYYREILPTTETRLERFNSMSRKLTLALKYFLQQNKTNADYFVGP